MRKIPRHIAVIMDGNGRWAKENKLSRAEGHAKGAERIEGIIDACKDRGVKFITLYAFSEENWHRPDKEVTALMELLRIYIINKREGMLKKGVRFKTIGDLARLPKELVRDIKETEEFTLKGDAITMIVALSYGSRQEIVRAVQKLVDRGVREISQEMISSELDTKDIPDPDLLIRTSGEFRISNFLLWQLAYSEIYITETLWPDFDEVELDHAIESYSKRERRFGMTSEQVS